MFVCSTHNKISEWRSQLLFGSYTWGDSFFLLHSSFFIVPRWCDPLRSAAKVGEKKGRLEKRLSRSHKRDERDSPPNDIKTSISIRGYYPQFHLMIVVAVVAWVYVCCVVRPTAFLTGERSNVRDSNRYKNIRGRRKKKKKKKLIK